MPAAMSTYATDTDLRDALGLPSLSTDDCQKLLGTAETLIDDVLGALPVDGDTGRKVTVADIETWQADKLKQATVLVAERLYRRPKVLEQERWQSQSGPDFSVSGPITTGVATLIAADVQALLRATGLRRRFGRARP